MSAEEIFELIKMMPDSGAEMRMLRTVQLYGEERKRMGKKLHLADERFLKDGEKLLYEEFAHVLKLRKEEVLPFIMKQISVEEK